MTTPISESLIPSTTVRCMTARCRGASTASTRSTSTRPAATAADRSPGSGTAAKGTMVRDRRALRTPPRTTIRSTHAVKDSGSLRLFSFCQAVTSPSWTTSSASASPTTERATRTRRIQWHSTKAENASRSPSRARSTWALIPTIERVCHDAISCTRPGPESHAGSALRPPEMRRSRCTRTRGRGPTASIGCCFPLLNHLLVTHRALATSHRLRSRRCRWQRSVAMGLR